MPNRNYRKEYDNYHAKPAQKKRRAGRNKANSLKGANGKGRSRSRSRSRSLMLSWNFDLLILDQGQDQDQRSTIFDLLI